MTQEPKFTLFYVLRGLTNGKEGVYAHKCGHGYQLDDGHYFLAGDDLNGRGPYPSVDAARRAAIEFTDDGPWTWAFPLDGRSPYRIHDDDESELYGAGDDANIATVTRVRRKNDGIGEVAAWRFEIEGSYEVLTLEITTRTVEEAALVYARLLEAAAPYQ